MLQRYFWALSNKKCVNTNQGSSWHTLTICQTYSIDNSYETVLMSGTGHVNVQHPTAFAYLIHVKKNDTYKLFMILSMITPLLNMSSLKWPTWGTEIVKEDKPFWKIDDQLCNLFVGPEN